MSQPISLKAAERKVFHTVFNDGLWDIFLGCFLLIFAIAPLLSASLGDFWSSVVFLPFWGLVYLGIRLVRTYVVNPRVGRVEFGKLRKAKLVRFNLVMLIFNFLTLILGFLFARNFGRFPAQMPTMILGMLLLLAFSIGGYFLDFKRLYIYGLMVGFSPLIGEWLYTYRNASHHGFPITFTIAAGTMIVVGLALFIRFLNKFPVSINGISAENS